jgi:hypothetical protein
MPRKKPILGKAAKKKLASSPVGMVLVAVGSVRNPEHCCRAYASGTLMTSSLWFVS